MNFSVIGGSGGGPAGAGGAASTGSLPRAGGSGGGGGALGLNRNKFRSGPTGLGRSPFNASR